MNIKLHLLSALIFFSLLINNSVKAQQTNNTSSENRIQNTSKFFNKLTIVSGVGLSVINSDNRAKGYRSDVGLLKGNGYGPNISVGASYALSSSIDILSNLDYTFLKGQQDKIENTLGESATFRSHVISASGSAVYNIANKSTLKKFHASSSPKRLLVVPYVKAGLGLLYYNAVTNSEEELTSQDHNGFALIIPLGFGGKIKYSKEIIFAPEITFGLTTTDYIDTMGKSKGYTGNTDNLFSASIKMFYTPSSRK